MLTNWKRSMKDLSFLEDYGLYTEFFFCEIKLQTRKSISIIYNSIIINFSNLLPMSLIQWLRIDRNIQNELGLSLMRT